MKKPNLLLKENLYLLVLYIFARLLEMIQASYKYPDGSEYKGEWNAEGQRHGIGKKKSYKNYKSFFISHLVI